MIRAAALNFAAAFALALTSAAGLLAQSDASGAGTDELHEALRISESQAEADRIAGQIWEIWLTAPDEPSQELLDEALQRRRSLDFLGAFAALDRLVEYYPDYAEGWNQRATIHFMRGDYAASLADVAETLAREPRHFGALSGKAVILFRQGKTGLGELALRRALREHPWLRERAILDALPDTDL